MPESATVLAVDDNSSNLDVVTQLLGGAGYHVLIARDGERAVERALRSLPDLILLDVKMPGSDGFEVCRRLKGMPELAGIPVIFTTAASDEETKRRAFESGGIDYIAKPVARAELLARVATHLEIARYRHGLEREIERRTGEISKQNAERELLLENIDAQVWYLTRPGEYGLLNRAHAEFLGHPPEALVGRTLDSFLSPEVAETCRLSNEAAFQSSSPVRTEEWAPNAAGEMRLLAITKTPMRAESGRVEYVVCVGVDMTEEYELREKLRRESAEKELLIREVHHRVKNNLSVVASLLQLQLATVESGADAIQALRSSADRIYAMAHIHQQIYESGLLSQVPLVSFVDSLVFQLQSIYDPDRHVHVTTAVDDLVVDVSLGIPCGIVLNELVTNAFKHAFPDTRHGTVGVSITHRDGTCVLRVEDDGVGDGGPANTGAQLGATLVNALCEQLHATLDVDATSGRVTTITIPLPDESSASHTRS